MFEQGCSHQFMKVSHSPAAAIHQGSFLHHFFYLAVVSSHLKPSCQCSSVCIQLQFAARVISGPPGAEVIKSQIRNDASPVIAVWSGGRGAGDCSAPSAAMPPWKHFWSAAAPRLVAIAWSESSRVLSSISRDPLPRPQPHDALCRDDKGPLNMG